MCGITGFSGSFDSRLLESMTDTVRHRGPDDFGTLHLEQEGVGLGHRRLSIIDLSELGRQPMWDTTNTLVISFNGEIYNYRELRKELQATGYKFRSNSDTEVLLALYLREGAEMLQRLNGIFAFALWDTRDRTMLVARDGLGVKPLYYCELPEGVLFASELKALLEHDRTPRSLDPVAVRSYLTHLWCPAPATPLESVRKLEPGHALRIAGGRIRERWQFYELPYGPDKSTLSVPAAMDGLTSHIREAVRRQLVADVDVGAFLSGGLDSSSVVAMARELQPDKEIQCFTIGFKGTDPGFLSEMGSDLPYAEKVAAHLGVRLHRIDVGPELADDLEQMVVHLDEPQADVAPLFVQMICSLARSNGIKVLLSGAGGDDILGGYRRHRAIQLERYWRWLPAPARRAMQESVRRVPVHSRSLRQLAKAFQYAGLPAGRRLVSYYWWCRPDIVDGLFHPDIRAQLARQDVSAPFTEALARLPADTSELDRMLFLDGQFFLPDHNLNYTDKMSMAVGVETRVPLLDPDLVAFAARLPDGMKQHGPVGKWLFKKAMAPYLPREVIDRPKVGFGGPVRYWLKNQLRPLVDEMLSASSLARGSLFDAEAVGQLIAMDRRGAIDASYTILAVLCTQLWCRRFL